MGVAKGMKMTPEQIAKRTEARRKNKLAKLAKAKKPKEPKEPVLEVLPLRHVGPIDFADDTEEFGRFLGAAWRAYKGR